MIRCDRWLQKSGMDARMIMQVHDELVFEVAEGQVDEAIAEIRRSMVEAAEMSVPLVVDIGVGVNWEEAH
jgi:DNA polymerase-1